MISTEAVLPNRNTSSEVENRNSPAGAKLTTQSSHIGETTSDFGSLVQIVKVRMKSASGRTISGGQDPSMSQVLPNRKLGRYERLALFCHSSSDGSQGVSAAVPVSQDSNLKLVGNQARKTSLGAISTLSESNFLASKMDRFSPTGGWSQLVNYHGTWHSE